LKPAFLGPIWDVTSQETKTNCYQNRTHVKTVKNTPTNLPLSQNTTCMYTYITILWTGRLV